MRSLFGLAPGGVCRAGLLPGSRCALTAPFHPCHASCLRLSAVREHLAGHSSGKCPGAAGAFGGIFLLHFPSARAAQALPGTVPCGARTFLGILSNDATVWPTPPRPLSHDTPLTRRTLAAQVSTGRVAARRRRGDAVGCWLLAVGCWLLAVGCGCGCGYGYDYGYDYGYGYGLAMAVAWLLLLLLLLDLILTFGAPPQRRSRRAKPAGRRTGMCGVFREGRMPSRKIPAGSANPAQRAGRAGGVCLLCARFLCTSKERWLAPSRRESS
jgi:hypothetical protein